MLGQHIKCPTTTNVENLAQLVGPEMESQVSIEGHVCPCLLDTGSQVSTISENFYADKLSHVPLRSIETLLDIRGANGHSIPYLGFIEVNMELVGHGESLGQCPVLALIVPHTSYHDRVPVLIGTNIINFGFEANNRAFGSDVSGWPVSSTWKDIYHHFTKVDTMLQQSVVNPRPKSIPAHTKVLLQGVLKTEPMPCKTLIVTEEVQLPAGLVLSRGIIELEAEKSHHPVTVHLTNFSSKEVTIPKNAVLCHVHRVTSLHTKESLVDDPADLEFLSQFNLENLPSDLPTDILDKLCCVLLKWKSVFARDSLDLGHTDMVKQSINLSDETPIKQRHRRIPPAMLQEIKQHLSEMLDRGVIRESSSPWSSPLVFARKASGALRLCLDLRAINKRTIKDAYYLPRINETLDSLSGSKFFSCLDLEAGYWQIEIEEEHKQRTAFSAAPLGFFEYNRMPFGATNGPAIFQRLMEECLGIFNPKNVSVIWMTWWFRHILLRKIYSA